MSYRRPFHDLWSYALTVEQGSYNVEAKVRTKDEELITCLKADITFHR